MSDTLDMVTDMYFTMKRQKDAIKNVAEYAKLLTVDEDNPHKVVGEIFLRYVEELS